MLGRLFERVADQTVRSKDDTRPLLPPMREG
jgi:hypothetical protein